MPRAEDLEELFKSLGPVGAALKIAWDQKDVQGVRVAFYFDRKGAQAIEYEIEMTLGDDGSPPVIPGTLQ